MNYKNLLHLFLSIGTLKYYKRFQISDNSFTQEKQKKFLFDIGRYFLKIMKNILDRNYTKLKTTAILLFLFLRTYSADPIISTGNIRVIKPSANSSNQYTYTYFESFPTTPLFSCSFVGFDLPAINLEALQFKITNLSVGLDKANLTVAVQATPWNQIYFSCAASSGDPLQLFLVTADLFQTISQTQYRSDIPFSKSQLKFQPKTTTLIIYPNLCSFKYLFYPNSNQFYLQPSLYHQNTVIGPIYFDATPIDFTYNNPFFTNDSIILSLANTAVDMGWVQFTLVVHTVWTATTNRLTGYSFLETDKPGTLNIYNSSDTIVNNMNLSSGATLYILQGMYRINMSVQNSTRVNVTIINTRQAVVTGQFWGLGEDVYLYKSFWDNRVHQASLQAWHIALIVIGSVALLVGITVGVYCFIKKKRAKYLEEQRAKLPPRSDSTPAQSSGNGAGESRNEVHELSQPKARRQRKKSFMSSFPSQMDLTNAVSSVF